MEGHEEIRVEQSYQHLELLGVTTRDPMKAGNLAQPCVLWLNVWVGSLSEESGLKGIRQRVRAGGVETNYCGAKVYG